MRFLRMKGLGHHMNINAKGVFFGMPKYAFPRYVEPVAAHR